MVTLPGWTPVKVDFIDPRWEAVKNDTVAWKKGLVPSPQGVNEWVNSILRYRSDDGDYWQPPETTLKLGTGDCEDYALLKRALLIAGGWPKEGIAFMLVNDLVQRMGHAFVIAGAMVMDSRTNIMLPVFKAVDYAPIRMFTEEGTFHFERA
jgi:predicted transglutaminase-like cysteine proteinase